jgi:hypothetical protein
MSGPGKGRYTTYVGNASPRNTLLWKLFNKKAPNDAGVFYGGQEPSDNSRAAAAAVTRATANVVNGVGGIAPANGKQAADPGMFPNGVNLNYTGTSELSVPNLEEVEWKKPGDPANAYVPDLSSPGPGRTLGIDKDENPNLTPEDLKPNYVAAAPGTGTVSPDTTSTSLGAGTIGKDLNLGKSSV